MNRRTQVAREREAPASARQSGADEHRVSRPSVGIRLWASLRATLAGWLAAVLSTLWIQLPELWRNAAPGVPSLLHDLAEGMGLWLGFTIAVCAGVWCVAVLPLALLVPPQAIVRHRRQVVVAAAVIAVLFVGWRLETWADMIHGGPGGNPLVWPVFDNYACFAAVLAAVTALAYARLLRSEHISNN